MSKTPDNKIPQPTPKPPDPLDAVLKPYWNELERALEEHPADNFKESTRRYYEHACEIVKSSKLANVPEMKMKRLKKILDGLREVIRVTRPQPIRPQPDDPHLRDGMDSLKKPPSQLDEDDLTRLRRLWIYARDPSSSVSSREARESQQGQTAAQSKQGNTEERYSEPKSLKEWVGVFGKSRNTLARWFKNGQIEARKTGRSWRVAKSELPEDKAQ